MSEQNDNTSKNIDDYFANIATETPPKTNSGDAELDALFGGANTPEPEPVGIDEDFLKQLGSDNAFNLEPTSTLDVGAVGGGNFSGFDSLQDKSDPILQLEDMPTSDDGVDFGDAALGAGVGLAAGAAMNHAQTSTQEETPKKKGFFSGRFGKKDDSKKETPAKRPTRMAKKPVSTDETVTDDKKAKPKFSLFGKKDKAPKAATEPTNDTLDGNADDTLNTGETSQAKPKKSLFGAKSTPTKPARSAKAAKPAKTQGANGKKNNTLLLGGLLAVVLAGGAGYMLFLNNDTPAPTPAPAPAPVAQTPAPAPEPVAPAPTTDILPNNAPVVNPDEILNAEIPSDQALQKEEIDRLKDTDTRLNEQGKIIEEQLTVMEELTAAKAEQIALLEAQIKELEKQKTNVGTAAAPQAQGATPAPQGTPSGAAPTPATPAPAAQ